MPQFQPRCLGSYCKRKRMSNTPARCAKSPYRSAAAEHVHVVAIFRRAMQSVITSPAIGRREPWRVYGCRDLSVSSCKQATRTPPAHSCDRHSWRARRTGTGCSYTNQTQAISNFLCAGLATSGGRYPLSFAGMVDCSVRRTRLWTQADRACGCAFWDGGKRYKR